MKKISIIPLLFLLSSLLAMRLYGDSREVRRFGLFIGANDGGDARQHLLYADDDARSMKETMGEIGGIDGADSFLLIDPDTEQIVQALAVLKERIAGVENLVRRTEIMFYYSGHSDETGFMLEGEKLPYKDIREGLDDSGADVVIAVLDSCSSGAFTRSKGGQRRSPFLIDESSSMEGHAFLTSSSETELSQESDRIEGSFFTYYLIAGLRGAADNTGDGRVSLNEVYDHTFQETLAQTESTLGGPQHPAYEIRLTGTGDLVLTDLTIPTSALHISGELSGRLSVRNSRDKLVAEFTKYEEDTFKLALPAGEYGINLTRDGELLTARFTLGRNSQFFLTERDFFSLKKERTRFRGDTKADETYEEVPLSLSLVPGIEYPELSDDSLVRIQLGFISYAPRLEGVQSSYLFGMAGENSRGVQASSIFNVGEGVFSGVQGAGVFNTVEADFYGLQGAGVFNIANENMKGVQGAGLFNITDDSLQGVQGAGLFNIAGRPSQGIQASGLFNRAGEFQGVQAAGLFNSTTYLKGVQLSLVNHSVTMNGLQIGLVNISREMDGLALGLINLSRNGIVDGGLWYEYSDEKRLYTFFQSGNKYFYTLYFVGNSFKGFFEDPDNLVWGGHVGCRLGPGPFEIDLDVGARQSYSDFEQYRYETRSVPSFRAVAAIEGLGIFWGISGTFTYPGCPDSSFFEGESFDLMGNEDFKVYHDFILGVRF